MLASLHWTQVKACVQRRHLYSSNNPADVAQAPAQAPAKATAKKVRIVSPHSEGDSSSFKELPSPPNLRDSKNDSPASENQGNDFLEEDSLVDPFRAGSDLEDDNEADEVPSPTKRPVRRTVPFKARKTLGVDSDNPWRTSTLIGNLPNRSRTAGHGSSRDTRHVAPKAQKTLGISDEGSINVAEYRHQTVSPPTTDAVPPKAQRTLGIPTNPFQRSLSSKDPYSYDGHHEDDQPDVSRTSSILSNRGPLDVDTFARLMVTGDVDSAASTPSILPLQGILGDSSSNTDASSLSRQSIMDSQGESRLETPRTSHDSSTTDDELQRSLQISTGKLSSVPAGSHLPASQSRLLGPSNPALQINANFAESSPIAELSARPTTPADESVSMSPKTSGDLNKPLPLPPTSAITETGEKLLGVSISKEKEASAGPYELPVPRARVAPPPPLARRQSQLRSKNTGSSSGRAAPIEEEKLSELHATSRSTPATTTKPPAPPPPRRSNTSRNSILLDPPSLPELPSTPLQPIIPKIDKHPPPLPPARQSSFSRRPPRDASIKATLTSASNAPPPPPRRRGSSASSYSLRRPSSEIGAVLEEKIISAPSGSEEMVALQSSADAISKAAAPSAKDILSLQSSAEAISKVASPSAKNIATLQSSADVISKAAASNTIMADLSKLQQEVDALRGKYERSGSIDQSWGN